MSAGDFNAIQSYIYSQSNSILFDENGHVRALKDEMSEKQAKKALDIMLRVIEYIQLEVPLGENKDKNDRAYSVYTNIIADYQKASKDDCFDFIKIVNGMVVRHNICDFGLIERVILSQQNRFFMDSIEAGFRTSPQFGVDICRLAEKAVEAPLFGGGKENISVNDEQFFKQRGVDIDGFSESEIVNRKKWVLNCLEKNDKTFELYLDGKRQYPDRVTSENKGTFAITKKVMEMLGAPENEIKFIGEKHWGNEKVKSEEKALQSFQTEVTHSKSEQTKATLCVMNSWGQTLITPVSLIIKELFKGIVTLEKSYDTETRRVLLYINRVTNKVTVEHHVSFHGSAIKLSSKEKSVVSIATILTLEKKYLPANSSWNSAKINMKVHCNDNKTFKKCEKLLKKTANCSVIKL